VLEAHNHFTRHERKLGAMDPNIKLLIEELVKQMHEEIHEGFSAHDSIINMSFSEFESAECQRE
jgi:hypothetical protein